MPCHMPSHLDHMTPPNLMFVCHPGLPLTKVIVSNICQNDASSLKICKGPHTR